MWWKSAGRAAYASLESLRSVDFEWSGIEAGGWETQLMTHLRYTTHREEMHPRVGPRRHISHARAAAARGALHTIPVTSLLIASVLESPSRATVHRGARGRLAGRGEGAAIPYSRAIPIARSPLDSGLWVSHSTVYIGDPLTSPNDLALTHTRVRLGSDRK